VQAKVGIFNPDNSIKDRMAVKMLVAEKGKLKPGGTIIEGTSGIQAWVWHLQPV
jgi:cystathionine beta-synthase